MIQLEAFRLIIDSSGTNREASSVDHRKREKRNRKKREDTSDYRV